MMAGDHRISEAVYYRVNEIIGHHKEVVMRRDKLEMIDIILNNREGCSVVLTSGSKGEGFEMEGSDIDIMSWSPYIHVIYDLSQVYLQNIPTKIFILMEDKYTRPGFVLLRRLNLYCICNSCRNEILETCMQVNNHTYIISSLFRNAHFQGRRLRNATLHGPCTSGLKGDIEYDLAHCYASKHWPPQAFHWIERCKSKQWPSPPVLRHIIQSGCHFIAIGDQSSSYEFAEWRLSFSQAEQKLVYSMNHIQFLVYGLLKLFLKEVINKDIPNDNQLLCSYFLKTAVFWEVQENVAIQWNINNFLNHFWTCYKLLMKWVHYQYCPNFFVPQNNMFYPKITGTRQQQLFHQMLGLYNEGFHCLLRCSSIRDKLYSALIHPQHPITNTDYFSEFDHGISLNLTVFRNYGSDDPPEDIRLQKNVEIEKLTFLLTKLKSNISQTRRIVVHRYIVDTIKHLAFLLQINQTQATNTELYRSKKQGLRLMKVISRGGCVSDALYLAIYLYNDGKYTEALCLLQELQSNLYECHVVYERACDNHYIQAVGGQPMSTKIKLAMASDILIPFYTQFPEIMLELRVRKLEDETYLLVSPFVLLHFLTFLCHYHLGNSAQQHQSLYNFHTTVNMDKYMLNKRIQWEMLGICHQLSKHHYQALECYWEAQKFSQYNIKQSYRIQAVERQIYLDQLHVSQNERI